MVKSLQTMATLNDVSLQAIRPSLFESIGGGSATIKRHIQLMYV